MARVGGGEGNPLPRETWLVLGLLARRSYNLDAFSFLLFVFFLAGMTQVQHASFVLGTFCLLKCKPALHARTCGTRASSVLTATAQVPGSAAPRTSWAMAHPWDEFTMLVGVLQAASTHSGPALGSQSLAPWHASGVY